ncbi:hypothetical protein Poli38472_006975 [Pythium oligandrum]|uniref:Uncharacterized protein n=1 Tax=Pythium oligandrum TaxID=41045 RepID=A0A8K1FCX8_PYTOL|nr:hypothetical protein Poli38472_006975 [Pythium oligandrum]|eukprot:TMW58830.1 hypothetical protein Poli38472_006975 [Pythium oligandrum]
MTEMRSQEIANEPMVDVAAPRKRGRKRFLPQMTNSERARYYRQKDAMELAAKKMLVRNMRLDIDSLRFQARLHRRLIEHTIAATPRFHIANQVAAFISNRLERLVPVLQKCRHEIKSMEISGEETALVIRLKCVLRGRLLPTVVRRIYPHVLGNSVALGRMMHSDVEYPCSCEFFFTPDGSLAHHIVEVDAVSGYLDLLGSLQSVGRVLADIGLQGECGAALSTREAVSERLND